jgi:DNA mismatch repair ATPase MutS
LFNYLKDTQKTSLKNVSRISYYGDENKVNFDDITIKNLEILKSSYESNKKYSLL